MVKKIKIEKEDEQMVKKIKIEKGDEQMVKKIKIEKEDEQKKSNEIANKTYNGIKKLAKYCLERNKLEITFIKKDNSKRTIICTLDNEYLKNDKKYIEFLKQKEINNNNKEIIMDSKMVTNDDKYINVWDITLSDWRKINLDTIIEINFL